MIEQVYKISTGNDKAVEKVIYDENLHYLHMVFNKGEGLPEHFSNSNVYMTVVRGTLSIGLNDQDIHEYSNGALLKIPVNTKMNVKNLDDDTLELIVVKAPAPTK
ncbi:MAG: cupin domain-containing protein [Leptotrichiaceae bacterium]|jgi:quercetin dioxygenase-like cupin family protein